jgi:hypothetical protein
MTKHNQNIKRIFSLESAKYILRKILEINPNMSFFLIRFDIYKILASKAGACDFGRLQANKQPSHVITYDLAKLFLALLKYRILWNNIIYNSVEKIFNCIFKPDCKKKRKQLCKVKEYTMQAA